ncbi:DUF927 domain-containing protein [Martelella alba]|uniref:DUF927 domain-containing protein n=1 Tax=Martelella alba TaxID=2590451 RepID=A0ABY2SRU0_9HYPH|nr:DUF927 domain-containing protein [Martelella alba]TKI06796.1 DUF927 domain-containing protein [Martelella alba]
MASIRYSRGVKRTAKTVEQRSATSEDEFINKILADVASAKYQQFFCAPVRKGVHPKGAKETGYQGEKYWRLSAHVEPWRVARFDCDGFDSLQTFEALKAYLQKFKGFLYTTTNYTPTTPRCRFVILLDKEVNRDEGKRVCQGIAAEIDSYLQDSADFIGDWQPVIPWDESVYLAEQQCYMPVVDPTGNLKTKTGEKVTDAIALRFDGELANVAHYLAIVPEEPKRQRRKIDTPADQTETPEADPTTSEYWALWEGIDQHTMDDLRSALFSPGMIKISEGPRKPWQAVIASLCYLKDTPFEDAAYQLALEWSEAGGAAFDLVVFTQTWETSRADLTSYKAIFADAQRKGWENPQVLRPYLEKEKTGFYMTGEGLMENYMSGSGNSKEIAARKVSAAFAVRGRTRDAYGDNWGRLVEFRDFDGETKHYVVPDEHLHKQGSDVPQRLAAMGLWINSGMAKSLLTYLNITSATRRITCTAITGWHESKVFVLPDRSVGKDADSVMYQHRGRDKCQLAQAGTLTEWQQQIAAKCAGNSRLVFSVCVALAAPLMGITGMDGGVFSLLGASTKGKSTAQHVAASVWGKGTTSGGYVRTWNTSLVGLEVMATTHNDLPLILDELKAVSPKIVGSTAYMLAMGRGKERGTKDITLREVLQWRTLVLASSERPFDSYLKAAGETVEAGQQARFVDVPAIVSESTGLFDTLHGFELTEEYSKQFADGLNRSAAAYYGTAGIAWLEYITRSIRSKLIACMDELRETFRQQYRPQDTGAQLDRVMERFTLCAVAGEVATAAGITGWQEGEAFNGVGSCFLAYVAERGTLRDMEGLNGVDHLRQYLSTNGPVNFMRCSSDRVRVHDGYIALLDGGSASPHFDNLDISASEQENEGVAECYWIIPEAMQRILANHNREATLNALEDMGALLSEKDKHGKIDHNPRKNDPVFNHRRRYYRIVANALFS